MRKIIKNFLKGFTIVYLTAIHMALGAMIFFYTNDRYTIARVDAPVSDVVCCQGDQLTALLNSHLKKH